MIPIKQGPILVHKPPIVGVRNVEVCDLRGMCLVTSFRGRIPRPVQGLQYLAPMKPSLFGVPYYDSLYYGSLKR